MQCPSALNAARSESETLRNLSIAQRSAVDDEHFFTADARLAAEQVECRTRLPPSRFLDRETTPVPFSRRPVFSTVPFSRPGRGAGIERRLSQVLPKRLFGLHAGVRAVDEILP